MMVWNMIQLNDEELHKVEEMGAALMPASEIALLLDIEADAFVEICKNYTSSEIYKRYHKGRLTTKLELRKTVIKLAKAGSPAAEPLALKFLNE